MQDAAGRKRQMMTEEPVKRLVAKMALPTIAAMMMSAIYNMADTFFVGQIGSGGTAVSTYSTAAVGIAFSLMAIIQAVGFTLGMGAGNTIARLLGADKRGEAEKFAATSFFTSVTIGILMCAIGLVFLEPLVRLLGATDEIVPYAKDYVMYILIGAPFMMTSFVLNNIFRLQGSAFFSMIGVGVGGILNIILDPIFIFTLHMGVAGAAFATMISQAVSFTILLAYCGKNGNLPIRFRSFSLHRETYQKILAGGFPSFCRQALASVASICLNRAAGPFGAEAIAAMAVVGRLFMFAISALLGFGQGFQPVCGFNYGAKKYDRVLTAYWFCVKIGTVVLLILGAAAFAFAPQIVASFNRDPEVVRIGALSLRMMAVAFPMAPFAILSNMLLQTIGKTGRASLTSMMRQGLFFIPLVLILPPLLGVLGIQLSQPLAEVLSFIATIPITLPVLRALKTAESSAL